MKYKHKKTGIVLEKVLLGSPTYRAYYFNASWTVPVEVVEGSGEWEEEREEPLLVTQDGVEIFDNSQILYAVNINNWTASSTAIRQWAKGSDGGREYGWRFFSTKEARLHFVVNNKPVLSYGEFLSGSVYRLGVQDREALVRLITEKLKANDSNL